MQPSAFTRELLQFRPESNKVPPTTSRPSRWATSSVGSVREKKRDQANRPLIPTSTKGIDVKPMQSSYKWSVIHTDCNLEYQRTWETGCFPSVCVKLCVWTRQKREPLWLKGNTLEHFSPKNQRKLDMGVVPWRDIFQHITNKLFSPATSCQWLYLLW